MFTCDQVSHSDTFQWNFIIQNMIIFIHDNAFENVFFKMLNIVVEASNDVNCKMTTGCTGAYMCPSEKLMNSFLSSHIPECWVYHIQPQIHLSVPSEPGFSPEMNIKDEIIHFICR